MYACDKQKAYFVLKIRTKIYNPRKNEDLRDIFEINEMRFETEKDAIDFIRTRNISSKNVISLEHRIVKTIDIHEMLNQGNFTVGVNGKQFTFNSKEDALKFLQS